jgi:hypothetical protein
MKTIRKQFWVNDVYLDELKSRELFLFNLQMSPVQLVTVKNKITIEFEVPEKKIELTEGEFLKAIEKFPNSLINTELLRKALFGDK